MSAEITTIARKELGGFFASPAAFLFLGAFLGVTLFVFFWVDTFFARNLADVRPLFQWMPLLLIFLVAALTMRAWAEERRSGTLELLLTAPTSSAQLVLGKFLGVMGLVAVALALTLPLPVTVAMLGPLDWGPVVGGYVAALALAAAYVSIGLWVSSRTDNQIVSLILTVAIAGAFYLVGSPAITSLFGHRGGELLRELGAGSRFDSITRGVLDLRDLYYYASITAAFLLLNRWSIETLRWAGNPDPGARARHRGWNLAAGLVAANLLAANAWLYHLHAARLDLTQGQAYSLSDATRDYLGQLREPLLIRGYFSAATHPLLAPLVPQMRDLLEEYAVAGGGRVRVEFVDPQRDPTAEQEAASRYGIKPVPFQTASRYQTSVVNSYFDILVSYGNEYQVLNFRDLIDVKTQREGDFEIALRNPEYDLTRTIRKVLTAYQGGGSPFDTISRPLRLDAYLSAGPALPPELQPAREALEQALAPLRAAAGDKLTVHFADPGTEGPLATQLTTEQGLRPLVASVTVDARPFWFHLVLSDGERREQVALPTPLDADGFRRSLEGAVKRFSPGFLKTVAVLSPEGPAGPGGFRPMGAQYNSLREVLGASVNWLDTDLRSGQVPPNADMLLVLGPENLDERQRFAIDQFLMQGGSVVVTTAPTTVLLTQRIEARPTVSGLEDWLAGHGLEVEADMVLDPISGALPIPVERPIGNGLTVREIQLAPYPYIIDVRGDGLDPKSPVTAGLGQVSVPWASPVRVDEARQQGRRVTTLLRSSPDSWSAEGGEILPDYRTHPDLGFAPGSNRAARPLAVMLEGRFESAFKGRPSPLLQPLPPQDGASAPEPAAPSATAGRVIEHSPDGARLVLIGAPSLFDDQALEMIGRALGTRYLKPAELLQNLVDWSLEDQGLLGIRSRGQFARTLVPMPREAQAGWETGNYVAALAGLLLVWALHRWRRRAAARRHLAMLAGSAA